MILRYLLDEASKSETVSTIYIARHGSTPEDESHEFCGWTDSDLSETGRQQAKHSAAILGEYDFQRVFSSDLSRALDTAYEIASEAHEVVSNKLLRTWGIGTALAGKPKTPETEAIKWNLIKNPDTVPEGDDAESINESIARQMSGLALVLIATPPGTSTVLVAHSSMVKNLARIYHNEKLHVGPGGIVKLEISANGTDVEVLFPGSQEDDTTPAQLRYSPDQEREPNGQFGSGGSAVTKDIGGAMEHVIGTAAMHALVRVGDKLLDKDGNKVTVKEKGEHTLKVYDHKANDYKELAKSEVGSYKWGSRSAESFELRYSEDQPRDDHGRFGEGSGAPTHESLSKSDVDKGIKQISKGDTDAHRFILEVLQVDKEADDKSALRFAYVKGPNGIQAAGVLALQGSTARVEYVGSLEKGGGSKVMASLESQAREAGVKQMTLTANADNFGFYEKQGFSHGRPQGYTPRSGDLLVMKKSLK